MFAVWKKCKKVKMTKNSALKISFISYSTNQGLTLCNNWPNRILKYLPRPMDLSLWMGNDYFPTIGSSLLEVSKTIANLLFAFRFAGSSALFPSQFSLNFIQY
jgi:hypothetical protein